MNRYTAELLESLDERPLVVMPISRLFIERPSRINEYRLVPSGMLEIPRLMPVANQTLECSSDFEPLRLDVSAQKHREIATSLTGFCTEVLAAHSLIAFQDDIPWEPLLRGTHASDVELLRKLSASVERVLDWLRYNYCRLDLPDTLPGAAGSWSSSGEYLGALLYSPKQQESHLIAGSASENALIVKGLGLDLTDTAPARMPSADEGEVAAICVHGLRLFSDAMHARNDTDKFLRAIVLLEFLVSPYEYESWKSAKRIVACYSAKSIAEYSAICERFKALTSQRDANGIETGLRTQVVHLGRHLEQLVQSHGGRMALFRELERYAGRMLSHMLKNKSMTWADYELLRREIRGQFRDA